MSNFTNVLGYCSMWSFFPNNGTWMVEENYTHGTIAYGIETI